MTYNMCMGEITNGEADNYAEWKAPENGRDFKEVDANQLRDKLNEPLDLEHCPAVDILKHQIDANIPDIQSKLPPNAPRQQIAYSLAVRLSKTSMYQRISEQAMFGPEEYERHDKPSEINKNLEQHRKELLDGINQAATYGQEVKLVPQNTWLHYVRGHDEKTAYRIYLSPPPGKIGSLFQDIAQEVPSEIPFEMKTFDPRTCEATDMSRLDKIIVYSDEQNFSPIWEAVQRAYQKHASEFNDRPAPGGGSISPHQGISLIKQPEATSTGLERTGTEVIAEEINQRIDNRTAQLAKTFFQQYKTPQEAAQSDEGSFFSSELVRLGNKDDLWYLGEDSVTTPQKEALDECYREALFDSGIRSLVAIRTLSLSGIRGLFIKEATANTGLSESQKRYISKASELRDERIIDRVDAALKRTGLAIAFNHYLQSDKNPSEALDYLLKN